MKIIASIEARMKSSRLPGKVLKKICNKPVLLHIVERLKKSKHINDIVIATSLSKDDDVIEKFALKNNISYYRGSEEDVLKRLLGAHEYMKTDIVVEITGDSPLIDWEVVDKTIEMYLNNNVDYVSNTLKRSHPIGVRSQVFGINILKECENLAYLEKDREHVTTFICKNDNNKYKLLNYSAPKHLDYPRMRLTLDYQEDYDLINKIYEHFYPEDKFCLFDVIKFLNSNPDISSINKNCKQRYKEGA